MQLRPKITLLIFAVISISMIANYAIQKVAVQPSFRALEKTDALNNWERVHNAILRDRDALSALCFDWASWDDAYGFVLDKNPSFFDANLKNPGWFTDQQIDLLYFCKPDGTVYWKHVARTDSGEPATLTWLPGDRLPANHPLLAVEAVKNSRVDGFINTELGFMMIAARPVLTSENTGPLGGVLIFGRRISDSTVDALKEQTGVDFTLRDPSPNDIDPSEQVAFTAALNSTAPVEQLIDSSTLAVRGLLRGLDDQPVMMIQTAGQRHISQQGHSALVFATWFLVASGVLTLVALLVALRWLVLKPLGALTQHAVDVGESGKLTGRLDLNRNDELGTLARALNEMLEQLEEFRTNSITMSRQAGMAEVAAGVLHNVGNAMTNVGVLAESLASRLAGSRVASLSKVSVLLNDNSRDLPGFFAEGRQGQQLPAYITQLSQHLNSEVADAKHDLAGLQEGLQHIKLIVASHQSLATTSNFAEVADLNEVVSMSKSLVEASLLRHSVALEVQRNAATPVSCDRSKLSQVLVNLLTNAKEALVAAGTPDPRIIVRIRSDTTANAIIEVSDNGPGIKPEHVSRLFSKGFSTKSAGHGIGLHYCWLAIREMNGSLTLVSREGHPGATFRIELPVRSSTERLAA